ncbi:MAG: cytochrome ubiquinol oxidase subunit I [candidate division Zixibacteria bacterium]|nr:cytochrome ubiquinol oxidase subunit I [candidate division Zixibacteria bacterium]
MYPNWEPFISNGLLMAIIAIPHVFVSHFAIGGGLYLVLAEIWAKRKNDNQHLEYVKKHSRFFALTTLVYGAVTGVGIWVTIGLIHPNGTKWLINNYVWAWATEWVFFFIEIAAALIYYYGWKKLKSSTHIAVGWIYFISAWMSLVIINGILTFMLTPAEWVTTGNFWDGFLNPTYLPSTLFRTCIAIIVAGLFATLSVAKEKNVELKIRVMRRNGAFILIPLLLSIPIGIWYYNAHPQAVLDGFTPGSAASIAFQVMLFASGILFLLTLLSNIIFPRHSGYVSAGVLMMCGLLAMGGFEWSREAIRKPFVIQGFLYSNNLLASEVPSLPATEPLMVTYSTGDRGRDLYLSGCRSCHTISGYKSLDDKLAGLDEEFIANIIPRLHLFQGRMAPFPGNDDDAIALAGYLKTIAGPDPLTTHASLTETQKADIVFQRRCGGCHTMTGFRPLADTFEGIDAEETEEIILVLEDLTEEMPPFTGTDEELKLLIAYLTGGVK